MPTYLVKQTGARSADYVTLRKGLKDADGIIAKWKQKGYTLVIAPNPYRAIEKIIGLKLGKGKERKRN